MFNGVKSYPIYSTDIDRSGILAPADNIAIVDLMNGNYGPWNGKILSGQCSCGNGVVTAPEQCDDGNFRDGDGCSPSCVITPVWKINSSYPPNRAIDARIPHAQGNPAVTHGWNSTNLTFIGSTQDILANSFSVTVLGGAASPVITSIVPGAGQNEIVVNFDRKLSPGNRTIIKHLLSNTQVCLGYFTWRCKWKRGLILLTIWT